jgi:hypothetical protein
MPPKPSLTAAGRSAAAGAGGGAAAAAAARAAGGGGGATTAAAEETPYALLTVPEKLASIRAKMQGEGEWTQDELFDLMYWCVASRDLFLYAP